MFVRDTLQAGGAEVLSALMSDRMDRSEPSQLFGFDLPQLSP